MQFGWKTGSRGMHRKVNPQTAGEHLEVLRQESGGDLTAECVVRDAATVGAALHTAFEWRDQEAAHQYRLEQARCLLRSVMMIEGEGADADVQQVYTTVVRTGPEGERLPRTYTALVEALSEPVLREQVLESALNELLSFQKKYAHLEELAEVITAIGEVAA